MAAPRLSALLLLLLDVRCLDLYAEPIRQPAQRGVYEFVLVIESKLTMSVPVGSPRLAHRTLVDYDLGNATFTRRDPSPGTCNAPMLDERSGTQRGLTDSELKFGIRLTTELRRDLLMLDGRQKRVVAINGSSPGPLLVVPYMAEVHVVVHNRLHMDSVTLHFHGIDKRGSWYEDGVTFLQQCPIATGSIYEYRFVADNPGTHWYHGHLQMDRSEGLLGGFVVLPPNRSVRTKNDLTITPTREYFMILQDYTMASYRDRVQLVHENMPKWYNGYESGARCFDGLRMHDHTLVGGAAPFDSVLINSKGWHNQSDIVNNAHRLELETFRIKRNEHVLFRIVNGAANAHFMLHIRSHPLTVVAADGNKVKPVEAHKMIIMAGERYDVLIKGRSRPTRTNYLIVVETLPYLHGTTGASVPVQYGLAKLEYEDASLSESAAKPVLHSPECTPRTPCVVFNCPFAKYPSFDRFVCHHAHRLKSDEPVDPRLLRTRYASNFQVPFVSERVQPLQEHFFNFQYDTNVNGYSFQMPGGMPYFYHGSLDEISTDCAKTKCDRTNAVRHDPECRCFYHVTFPLNATIQVGFPVVAEDGTFVRNNAEFDCSPGGEPSFSCNDLKWQNASSLDGQVPNMNLVDPPLRDTFLLPAGGFVVVRFHAANPGWWFLHCHIELHATSGSAFAFRVGEHQQLPPPPRHFRKDCGVYRNAQLSQEAREFALQPKLS